MKLQKKKKKVNLVVIFLVVALVFAIPMGMLAAYKRGTAVDLATVSISLLGTAIPGFLLSMFFMLFFDILGIFPRIHLMYLSYILFSKNAILEFYLKFYIYFCAF